MFLTYKTHFDAAHELPKHEGKCKQLHGHRWVIEVTVDGVVKPNTGMIVDFADLKQTVNRILGYLDHGFLNNVYGLYNPTAENIGVWLWHKLTDPLDELNVRLARLRVYETPDCWIELGG